MKFQELCDFDCKSTSNINQRNLLGRNMTKVKYFLQIIGFLLLLTGFYYVEKKNLNHEMTK